MIYSPKDFLVLIKRSAVELLSESEYFSKEEELLDHVRKLAEDFKTNECYVNSMVYDLAKINRHNRLYYLINRQTGKRVLMKSYFDMIYTKELKEHIGIKFPKPRSNLFKSLVGDEHYQKHMNEKCGQYSIADTLREMLELFPEDNVCVPIHRHGSSYCEAQLREWEKLFKQAKEDV